MPNPYFQFKQFTVHHDRCAMKVGTDGCLLGAWADVDSPERILDIGAGTGLISLMLAQRFPFAHIEAVEIEKTCAEQAIENIKHSPWADRVAVHLTSIQAFEPDGPYDLIVSNPPYFTNAFAAPEENRHTARHDDTLSAQELINHAKRLLSPNGSLCLIIPTDRFTAFNTNAQREHFRLIEKVEIQPTPAKPPKRVLLKYGLHEQAKKIDSFYIETSRGVYSEHFTKLLEEFYLYL